MGPQVKAEVTKDELLWLQYKYFLFFLHVSKWDIFMTKKLKSPSVLAFSFVRVI